MRGPGGEAGWGAARRGREEEEAWKGAEGSAGRRGAARRAGARRGRAMADAGERVSVSVKITATHETVAVDGIDPAKPVADLKAALAAEDKAGVPAERQRLIYKGHVLKDEVSARCTPQRRPSAFALRT